MFYFQPREDPTLAEILDKIRIAVFKNGIRTIEFFKDHDKLRSGVITDNQFVCGLALACGKEAQLSRGEIQKLVENYRLPDGRVQYKQFCDAMENGEKVFNKLSTIFFFNLMTKYADFFACLFLQSLYQLSDW